MKLHDFELYPIDFYQGDKFIGSTHSLLTFIDIRRQIREEQSSNYSFIFKNIKYEFDKNGEHPCVEDEDFPNNKYVSLLLELL